MHDASSPDSDSDGDNPAVLQAQSEASSSGGHYATQQAGHAQNDGDRIGEPMVREADMADYDARTTVNVHSYQE